MNKLPLYTGLIFFCQLANSAIYKSVDENGNVIYSDKPGSNSESIKLGPVTTYKAPKYKPLSYGLDRDEEASAIYQSFKITSPEAGQSFWETTGAIKIAAEVEPELQQEFSHLIQFYMDGYKQGKASIASSISLINVIRGEHSVYAAILDKEGKILKRSETVKFTLHKPSVNSPNRQAVQSPPPITNTNPQ